MPSISPASVPWVAKCSTRYWASLPLLAQRLDGGLGGLGAEQDVVGGELQVLGHRAQLIGGVVQGRLRAQVIEIGTAAARCHRLHAAALLDQAGHLLPERLRAGLLVAGELGPLRLPRPLRRIAIEQRVAEADHRLGRGAGLGHAAQRLQRGDGRQHGDGMLARQPAAAL